MVVASVWAVSDTAKKKPCESRTGKKRRGVPLGTVCKKNAESGENSGPAFLHAFSRDPAPPPYTAVYR